MIILLHNLVFLFEQIRRKNTNGRSIPTVQVRSKPHELTLHNHTHIWVFKLIYYIHSLRDASNDYFHRFNLLITFFRELIVWSVKCQEIVKNVLLKPKVMSQCLVLSDKQFKNLDIYFTITPVQNIKKYILTIQWLIFCRSTNWLINSFSSPLPFLTLIKIPSLTLILNICPNAKHLINIIKISSI